jgi:transcriptional regulator with XRE-family HTH domain
VRVDMTAEEWVMVEDVRAEGGSPPLDTLADKLNYLFDKIRPTRDELGATDEPGRAYTNKEIADKINRMSAASGVRISAAYVGELRRGVADDPRTSHVRALAAAFQVDPAFFVDDKVTRRVQEQITMLTQLREMKVQQVALRTVLADTGLSPASALVVEQMVARLQEVERGRERPPS